MIMTTNEFKNEHKNCKTTITHLNRVKVNTTAPDRYRIRCIEHDESVDFDVDYMCRNPRSCMGGNCVQDYACNH